MWQYQAWGRVFDDSRNYTSWRSDPTPLPVLAGPAIEPAGGFAWNTAAVVAVSVGWLGPQVELVWRFAELIDGGGSFVDEHVESFVGGGLMLFTEPNWAGVNYFFEVNQAALTGVSSVRVFDVTAGIPVVGSQIDIAAPAPMDRLRIGPIPLTDGHEYEVQYNF